MESQGQWELQPQNLISKIRNWVALNLAYLLVTGDRKRFRARIYLFLMRMPSRHATLQEIEESIAANVARLFVLHPPLKRLAFVGSLRKITFQ
jgi:hypothetical protein